MENKKDTDQNINEQYLNKIKSFNKFLIVTLILLLATMIVDNHTSTKVLKSQIEFMETQKKVLRTQNEFLKRQDTFLKIQEEFIDSLKK